MMMMLKMTVITFMMVVALVAALSPDWHLLPRFYCSGTVVLVRVQVLMPMLLPPGVCCRRTEILMPTTSITFATSPLARIRFTGFVEGLLKPQIHVNPSKHQCRGWTVVMS